MRSQVFLGLCVESQQNSISLTCYTLAYDQMVHALKRFHDKTIRFVNHIPSNIYNENLTLTTLYAHTRVQNIDTFKLKPKDIKQCEPRSS